MHCVRTVLQTLLSSKTLDTTLYFITNLIGFRQCAIRMYFALFYVSESELKSKPNLLSFKSLKSKSKFQILEVEVTVKVEVTVEVLMFQCFKVPKSRS